MKRYFIQLLIFFLAFSASKSNDYLDESSKLMFGFYSNWMAPLKSHVSECQFTPSCSQYSKQAIKEFGLVKGMIMTTDRLMRCSGGHASSINYPYHNFKFVDRPHNHSVFGDGNIWSLGLSGSSSGRRIESDTVFSFARSLFENGESQLSKLELLRISFNNKNPLVQAKTNLLLGMNEFITTKSIKTLEYLSEIDKIDNPQLKFKYFILKYLYSDLSNMTTYSVNLCKMYESQLDSNVIQRLTAYSHYRNNELDNAVEMVDKISRRQAISGFDTIPGYMRTNFDKNFKSPLLAGIMSSILPGSGYVYAGRLKEGASALLINALLGAGIYSLFDSGNIGGGILTAMVSVPFYLGNIIGSANAAGAENTKYQQIVLHNLRNSLGITFYFSTDQLTEFFE